ncbi:MAG TPA: PASTA domain-containing protein [Micromonosporaceae bacterium]|jgi:beta-lactam-binding protein with PASTA domain|nr:PASTA domain-containing protein [Micromonosporaceae bacterium]
MFRSRVVVVAVLAMAVSLTAGCRFDASSAAPANATVPKVTGMRLSAAEHALSGAGFRAVKPIDDTGRDRVVVDPQNWIVDSQTPPGGNTASTGSTVTLKVRRPSDGAGSTTVTKGVVPNVTCMNLQDAQDTLQKAEFFNLASVDGLGQGRQQILDRDWVVTKQSVAAGTHAGPVTRIVLTAVKYGESTGSSGCKS